MRDMMYPTAGAGSSTLAMITGLIDVSGLFNAFLFGIAGALGGLLIKYLSTKLKKRWAKK
ncbi:MAG: hypothetical protein PF489_05445 [Salinivirgaceae bacterium]|jgi:hypothetical protein|nr:hypothetical protein [Salinivirgaceae bacterium]